MSAGSGLPSADNPQALRKTAAVSSSIPSNRLAFDASISFNDCFSTAC